MNNDLINYYDKRAKEYEKIYSKPERQQDIQTAAKELQNLFEGKEVFEIACGTGFWTKPIAEVAKFILATDVNLSVIEIARAKKISKSNVTFEVADLYSFRPDKKFQSLFGGFIWSHIPKQELDHFLKTINDFVESNGLVVLMDNSYVEGSYHAITETDEYGNTFQTRELDDGSSHKVLKNFVTESFLREKIKDIATEINFTQLKYFWILSYRKA